MSNIPRPLKSSDIIDYLYISLFMFTYRQTSNRRFNAILKTQLGSLNQHLSRPSITIKTITLFRSELVRLCNSFLLPESVISPDDPFDLILVITTLASQHNLELPEDFFEAIYQSQDIIAEDLTLLKEPIIDYFRSLQSKDVLIFQTDISLILFLVLDFLQHCYLSHWSSSLLQLKSHLIFHTCTTLLDSSFSYPQSASTSPNLSDSTPTDPVPSDLLQLLTSKKGFVVIHDDFKLLKYGASEHLIPSFDLTFHALFNRTPPRWYYDLITELIKLPVLYGTTKERKDAIITDLKQILAKYTLPTNSITTKAPPSSDSQQAPPK